jgi:pimeloyl-ACP methyl ester carboxylesterase
MNKRSTKGVRLAGWKSESGRAAYLAAYDDALSLWPVPFESCFVDTRFGTTHVIVSGSVSSPPVLLLHAATGFGATQWYPNAARISEHYRIYAIDFIGSAGRGVQMHPLLTREHCASWLRDLIGELKLVRPALVGSSQGGWLALNFALREPDSTGPLALLAPAACFLPIRPLLRLSIRLGPHMPAWLGPWSLKALFAGRIQVDDRIARLLSLHLAHFRYQEKAPFPEVFPEDELSRLAPETLLLVGEHEVIYEPGKLLNRARELHNVKAELIPGAGHLINMECPDVCDAHLLGFLRSRPG